MNFFIHATPIVALLCGLVSSSSSSSSFASAAEPCPGDYEVVFVSGTSPNAELLGDHLETFEFLLGGQNNGGASTTFDDGFRKVTWDGGAPFVMPPNFFATTATFGLTVESVSNEFRISNDKGNGDNLFDSINALAAKDFQTNSPNRLFTSLVENTMDVLWFEVGTGESVPAVVDGFGVVFVDVKKAETTKMTAFAESGCVIAEQYVEPFAGGLSFLAIYSESNPTFKTVITTGDRAIDDMAEKKRPFYCRFDYFRIFATCSRASGGGAEGADIVVMDDFIFSEPQAAY